MAIQTTKGLKIYLENADAAKAALTITDISKSEPATVSIADTSGLIEGDIVVIDDSDFEMIDGKPFTITNIQSNVSFDLLGSNTTDEANPFNPAATCEHLPKLQMTSLPLASIDLAPGTVGEIDISTFEDPGATLPGNASSGTVTLNGYVDIEDSGYSELIKAEEDGAQRQLLINVPGNGDLIAPIIIASVSWTIPVEGSTGYAFAGTLVKRMRHLFDLQ